MLPMVEILALLQIMQVLRLRNTMPVKRTKGGGYRYGTKGKAYYGKGAKAKAARQGRAIRSSQATKGKK